jgi:uncharacterized protein (TIGR02147 family)
VKDIGQILKIELEQRKKANAAYSLRAFARYLGVSPAALSQLISGKRGLSLKRLNSLLEKLGLTPEESSRALRKLKRRRAESSQVTVLKEDRFRLITDWYHYAILSLGDLPDCKADPRWIAQRLGIRASDANEALARLQRLGLIKIQNGRYKQLSGSIRTTTDVPSSSIRRYHKNILGLAQSRIDEVPVEKREFTSITMAISTKNLEKAKKLTREFKRELSDLLDEGELDEVYQLSIQLFPLSKEEPK